MQSAVPVDCRLHVLRGQKTVLRGRKLFSGVSRLVLWVGIQVSVVSRLLSGSV